MVERSLTVNGNFKIYFKVSVKTQCRFQCYDQSFLSNNVARADKNYDHYVIRLHNAMKVQQKTYDEFTNKEKDNKN